MQDMSNFSMLELFRLEVEAQVSILNDSLLALESNPLAATELEALMRASHSIKGAARIVQLDAAVQVAHIMEDCFVAAQNGSVTLSSAAIDVLLQGVDFIVQISQLEESHVADWSASQQETIDRLVNQIKSILSGDSISDIASDVALVESASTSIDSIPTAELASSASASLNDALSVPKNTAIDSNPAHFSEDHTISREIASQNLSANQDMSGFSMLELFRMEVESQVAILNHNLLALEDNPSAMTELEALMRASHSIKGAARIVQLDAAVQVAHVMEDCFVAAQQGKLLIASHQVDILLQGVDLLVQISQVGEAEMLTWFSQQQALLSRVVQQIKGILNAPTSRTGSARSPNSSPEPTQNPPIHTIQDNGTNGSHAPEGTPAIAADKNGQSGASNPTSNTEEPTPTTPPSQLVSSQSVSSQSAPSKPAQGTSPRKVASYAPKPASAADRVIRVNAENLNRLMGLAGESLVEANWLQPFADSLLELKNRQTELGQLIDQLNTAVADSELDPLVVTQLSLARQKADECRQLLFDRLNRLELFARRSANLSDRLYREVIATHMRPFADGVQGFPRMVRDLAKQLGKQVKLEILGKSTPVDRDILEKLEAPLTHILRNAIDHGLELPEDRRLAGKLQEGTVRLEAVHRAGMLMITITDDGRGIDFNRLRQKVLDKGMVSSEMSTQLTEAELIEFLFLPGFSTAGQVTEISGRGVGLDVVQSMVQEVGGTLRAVSQSGKGMTFHLQLPLTLSVIRTLLVEIAGEPYAFPLTRINRIVIIDPQTITTAENRQYFTLDEQNIGLVTAHQILELGDRTLTSTHHSPPDNFSTHGLVENGIPRHKPSLSVDTNELSIVIIGSGTNCYGVVVDRFLGGRDLVVRPLDLRLKKVADISAVALMEDGSPVLIVDVEDLKASISKLLSMGWVNKIERSSPQLPDQKQFDEAAKPKKRILIVDDSVTVRETERKLLERHGYEVEAAINGIDGWNAVRVGKFDLVITDVDMPRMDGIKLVTQIRNHASLQQMPVIIVSYKDREEDRISGLEANADYYLTKTSFHDGSLLNAVRDLIGQS